MAKKVTGFIKLQVPAGAANPAPPVGPRAGQHGVNIMEFCKQFNARTQGQPGMIIPVEITVYADRSFTFITKTPPGGGPAEEGGRAGQGLARAEAPEGRHGHARSGPADRRDQDAGPERRGHRRRHEA
jgi:hypothetical protein